ncbi:MAG: TRAP transporter large permease [Pusillimonas sp.]
MTLVDLLPLLVFFILLLAGMAVAFSLAISGTLGIYLLIGPSGTLGMLQSIPYRTTASFTLVAIALFIMMAEFSNESGITRRLFAAANAWVGHMKGGLALATVLASAAFGALSGSSVAAAATMSRVAVPQMLSHGYSKVFAAGTASISGTLAILIPPSIPLIIYGVLTETSISKLLMAGVVPGIITVLLYFAVIAIWTRVQPSVAPTRTSRADGGERLGATKYLWPFMLIVLLVFGAMYTGAVTATEASAVGAAAVLFMWLILGRMPASGMTPISRVALRRAFDRSLRSTVMIVALLIGAYIFSFYLINSGATQVVLQYVDNLDVPPSVILLLIIVVYLILGCFMSQLEIMVLTLPFVFPMITSMGYDGIWFGIIVVKTIEIGLVTPPVGMNVFVVSSTSSMVSPADGFKGVVPFLVAELIALVLFVTFPEIVLFVPNAM